MRFGQATDNATEPAKKPRVADLAAASLAEVGELVG